MKILIKKIYCRNNEVIIKNNILNNIIKLIIKKSLYNKISQSDFFKKVSFPN